MTELVPRGKRLSAQGAFKFGFLVHYRVLLVAMDVLEVPDKIVLIGDLPVAQQT